jgi:molybdenum cofactor cytidylyltransferase
VNPALVILAAGASERLGECKALARIGDTCPLSALLEAGAELNSVSPLVIAGADFESIAAAAVQDCEVVLNPNWRTGRTSGIRLARALRPGRDLCLAPVDVPLVPGAVFAQLAGAWNAAGRPARGWLAPRFRGDFGHPIVVGRALLAELDTLQGDAPLRDLRALAAPLFSIEVESERVLDDLDTPADLARLRNLFR